MFFASLRDGQGQDQGQQLRGLLLDQVAVQLGGLVDEGVPVHADKPQVGPGMDHLGAHGRNGIIKINSFIFVINLY